VGGDGIEVLAVSTHAPEAPTKGTGLVLLTLASGQFLMTLDSSVMNVSIATVAKDVGTTVSGIQTAITLYTLVMAMFMVTGGKVGSIIGRRRAFAIGCVIYGAGSLTTALAPNLAILVLGWSLLEGIGAALIMPAIVALVAGNFPPRGRPRAYGLVMAAGAIAIAVGPLIGGFATTYFSWRWVFVGEVLVVLGILVLARRVQDAPPESRPKLDLVGTLLSAAGLGLAVFGVLRSSEWGWIQPKPDGPELLGVSPTVWLVLGGLFVVWLFLEWERRLEKRGAEPLVRPELLANRQLVGGLVLFFHQYLIQAGLFFTIPLYLSVALGPVSHRYRGQDPAPVTHLAAGRRRHPPVPAQCLAPAGGPPGAAGHAGRPGRPVRQHRPCRRGRDRDRPAAAGRARDRGAGLPAGQRDGVGGA
jgi:MFS family permease